MTTLKGTVQGGKIVVDVPPDWPDGTEVDIRLRGATVGLSEEDWPRTPEEIEEWVRRFDALEPVMTPEEDDRLRAVLAEEKAMQRAMWDLWCRRAEAGFR